ncbi:MAG: Kelch repeat-containing protein [Actinomycetia bacterium]|nr:Kelch repeat-containing protein [Actinomycetes bacterium]
MPEAPDVKARVLGILLVGLSMVALAACDRPASWSTRAHASFARQEVSYVYSAKYKRFFLGGGRSTVQESYDPASDTWKTVAPFPARLDHIQSVALNGRIYYIGGLVQWPGPAVGTVYIYDPASNSFAAGARMPAGRARGAGGVAAYGNKIYYAGGLHLGKAVSGFDVYDTVANTWKTLPNMPEARDHFQAAVVGGRFYAIGGRNTAIDATTTVNDAFNFATGSWTTGLKPLPTPRGGFAVAVVGTKLLVIGGEGHGRTYSTVEAYDTKSNSWSRLSPMPTARHGIEAAVCNGGVYVAGGGMDEGGGAPTDVQQVLFPGPVAACR